MLPRGRESSHGSSRDYRSRNVASLSWKCLGRSKARKNGKLVCIQKLTANMHTVGSFSIRTIVWLEVTVLMLALSILALLPL
jgi:hypothetical protein